MLVLKRKKDESITITTPDGTVIVVHLVRWTPSDVVVGISAPRDVEVVRSELIGRRS